MSSSTQKIVNRPPPRQPTGAILGGCDLIFSLGWTAFSLIFVIIPLAVFIAEWQTSNLLQTTGVTTEAVVISYRIDKDSDGDSYYVTYRYEVPVKGDRTQMTHEESVDADTYQALQALAPESRVTVRYSETNPEVVRLEGRSRTFQVLVLIGMMLVGGLFAAIGLRQIYSSWKVIYRARMLARHGEVVTGTVVDCWTETDSDGDKTYCVAFRFTKPDQSEITAAEYNRKAYHCLLAGDPVQVRYVPGKPDICSLEV